MVVEAGESVALWGANGAGKTTLLRCVLGLLRFSGRITVAGHDVRRDGKESRLRIGYVPQELSFYDELGVGEAISYFSRLKGLERAGGAEALDRVGLADHARKPVRALSGGMKQRLALAIALLGDPPVLVLDEVTASLDAVGREEFVALLERLSGSGRTMLFASHRVEEVSVLAHRVAVLEKGVLTGVEPRERFAARFGTGEVLHLHLAPRLRERALTSLRESGFVPSLNGVGILVPVGREHKAAPFRVLAEARIPVDDFSLVSVAQAASHAQHKEGR